MGIRTDLAMEAKALWEKSAGKTTKLAGVRARERERDGFAVTDVHILDRRGEAALGKPAGRYVTLELPPLMREVRPAAEALAAELRTPMRPLALDLTRLESVETLRVLMREEEPEVAVLVNADTYSAAEFFAAELQEQGAAVIVGEPTSGKGYSQQTFPLPHGGAVAISTGAYFTGSGASLIGTGLTLDAEVYNTGAEDTQLAAALELLKIR